MNALRITAAALLLGAWTEPPRSLSPVACDVARVVDVDTEERGQPRYHAATAELTRRRVVLIPHHANRDRIVADVLLGGANVGRAMDAAGWSKPQGARR